MSSPIPNGAAAERVAEQAKRARQRATRSKVLGWMAVTAALSLIIGFVVQGFWTKPAVIRPAVKEAEKTAVVAGGVSNFSGIDENSKPFQVEAQDGVQDNSIETLMHLKSVTGAFVRKDGGDVKIAADQAEYEIRNKDLKLTGNVRFEEPGKYVAHLQSAQVNLNRQRISTNQPVQVETANARVSADSMETSEDGKIVRLKGHVRARFETDLAN